MLESANHYVCVLLLLQFLLIVFQIYQICKLWPENALNATLKCRKAQRHIPSERENY